VGGNASNRPQWRPFAVLSYVPGTKVFKVSVTVRVAAGACQQPMSQSLKQCTRRGTVHCGWAVARDDAMETGRRTPADPSTSGPLSPHPMACRLRGYQMTAKVCTA